MKKFYQIILCALVAVVLTCTLSACGKKTTPTETPTEEKTVVETPVEEEPVDDIGVLQMDTKYVLSTEINRDESKKNYFIFHEDGTGEYKYYDYSSGNVSDFTFYLKYTFVDAEKSTVVCFYDSVEYHDGNVGSKANSLWCRTVGVSKNVLVETGGSIYINENYVAENLPNFGK